MDYIKVAGHDGLVRDRATGAIVNTNRADFDAYIARRDVAQRRQEQIDRHEEDITSMRSDISDIKQMLQILLRGNHGG